MLLRFSFAPVCIGALALLLLRRRALQAAVLTIVILLVLALWWHRTRAIDRTIVPTRVGENLFIASWRYPSRCCRGTTRI